MKSVLLVILTMVYTVNFAQETLTPENLWQLDRIYGEEVSPDGKKLLYLVKEYDLSANKGIARIHLRDLQTGNTEIITPNDLNVYEAQWRPDGNAIGYSSAESGTTQWWEINLNGGNKTQITALEGGIANFKYAPSLDKVSYTQEVKMESSLADKHPDLPFASGKAYDQLMFRHWTDWHDYHYSHIFYADYQPGQRIGAYADLMTGESYDAPLAPFGGSESFAWSPQGDKLAYVSKKQDGLKRATSTNSDIYIFDFNTGETINISSHNAGYDTEPVFSPSGRYLAWLSMAREGFESDRNMIQIADLETGERSYLTEDIDQTFGHVVWSSDEKSLYSLSPVNATYQIFEFKISGINRKQYRALTEGDHNINSIARAENQLIGRKCTMSKPDALYSWDIKTGKETLLIDLNAEMLAELKMGKVEKRMITTSDNMQMLTWVIYPPDFDPTKTYPTLLYCQGGPQSAVSQFFSYRWNFQLMAANGYIVVAPNRRGLPSFGQEWNDAISGDWGGQAMKDYLSAIDALAKEPYVDADRLGAVGASYGGYSVYYLAGIHEGRFKTFISHCGLYNLESWYASTEELFFANWDIGGAYWSNPMPTSYIKFSPHKLVQNWDTPIMVIHNELDFRVPLNQGLEAFTAAQLRGIPSKLLYYPDEGHWVLKPQNGVMWHREFYDWLDEWLK